MHTNDNTFRRRPDLQDHVDALRAWLRAPLNAFLVPRRIRAAVEAVAADLESTLASPPGQPLRERPPVGAAVRLRVHDEYLAHRHGAEIGAIGTVTAHSHLHHDDTGVLVDWGDGEDIRANLDELTAVL